MLHALAEESLACENEGGSQGRDFEKDTPCFFASPLPGGVDLCSLSLKKPAEE